MEILWPLSLDGPALPDGMSVDTIRRGSLAVGAAVRHRRRISPGGILTTFFKFSRHCNG